MLPKSKKFPVFIQECHSGYYQIDADTYDQAFKVIKDSFDYWGSVQINGEIIVDNGIERGKYERLSYEAYQSEVEKQGIEKVNEEIEESIIQINSEKDFRTYGLLGARINWL